jgi:hypothetical protein
MKKNIISGSAAIIFGLLIALGPQFLFRVCRSHDGVFSICHWSAQAEIGVGIIIAALGICLLFLKDLKIQFGLTIGIFLTGIIALIIPNGLIGGCSMAAMDCRRVAFPALTIIAILVLVSSAIYIYYLERKPRV